MSKSPLPSTYRYELTSQLGLHRVYLSDQPLSQGDLYVLSFSGDETEKLINRYPKIMKERKEVAKHLELSAEQMKKYGGLLLVDPQIKLLKRQSYFTLWQDFKVSLATDEMPRREFMPKAAAEQADYERMLRENNWRDAIRLELAVRFITAAAAHWEMKLPVSSPIPPGGAHDADFEQLEPEQVGNEFNYTIIDKHGKTRRLTGLQRRLTPGELTQFRREYNITGPFLDSLELIAQKILAKPWVDQELTEQSEMALSLQRERRITPEELEAARASAEREQYPHDFLDKTINTQTDNCRRALDFAAEYRRILARGAVSPREETAARHAVKSLVFALKVWEFQG
jgi:hypothetical protein